jgi:hypothetical protein
MPNAIFKRGSTRIEAKILRFASGTLTRVRGEAVYDPGTGTAGCGIHQQRFPAEEMSFSGGLSRCTLPETPSTNSRYSGVFLAFKSGAVIYTYTTSTPGAGEWTVVGAEVRIVGDQRDSGDTWLIVYPIT